MIKIRTITRRKGWPKCYRYIATERCGCVYAYRRKPEIIISRLDGDKFEWDSYAEYDRMTHCGQSYGTLKTKCKSWRSSLRRIVEPKRNKT